MKGEAARRRIVQAWSSTCIIWFWSGPFIVFLQTRFPDFFVYHYPAFIKAGVKVGSVTGKQIALVTKVNSFFLAIGATPFGYLQQLRVESAKRMLEEGTLTLNEIAYRVGYEDISFFRKVFIRLTGLRPKEYQQRFSGYQG